LGCARLNKLAHLFEGHLPQERLFLYGRIARIRNLAGIFQEDAFYRICVDGGRLDQAAYLPSTFVQIQVKPVPLPMARVAFNRSFKQSAPVALMDGVSK
jgi:hypothetical protein